MVKELKQTQRIMYRHLSRKRTRRSVHGYGKRPKDMESKSYMKGVAEILKSHNKDTPFFILLSFFTKSYRYLRPIFFFEFCLKSTLAYNFSKWEKKFIRILLF